MTTTIETYNGWANRETWALMLHINNDQWLQETALDYAKVALEEHTEEGETEADALYCLTDTVENWITEDLLTLENISGNQGLWSMLTDIGSLYRIDWREVSQALIDDAKAGC